MTNLNEQQFAKYSGVQRMTGRSDDYEIDPLPASMERHAPGEYQPTLPGMEKMLPGEMTHTDVFFKHSNAVDPETAEVPNSRWWFRNRNMYHENVKSPVSSLHPTQDWVDDNHIHEPISPKTLRLSGEKPKVERIGRKNIIHDGHHRAVRQIMQGKKSVEIERWG